MISSSDHNSTGNKTLKWSIIALITSLSLVSCSKPQSPEANIQSSPSAKANLVSNKQDSPTLENLQKAYNGESNAHVMYLEFAKKADEEGYKEVANLFRAAAAAEAIHRDNHAKVIKEMGATPKNNITTPEVKSTADNLTKSLGGNLSSAIAGESYERDSMYPGFIKQAKTEGNQAALQTFTYALAAETQHAQLYNEAKSNLESWRNQTHPFYVCTVSGETYKDEASVAKCPSVAQGESYMKVN
ncbi:rubrerythrin [Chondrocystis sp. NIES-4102]|nr:rubrerythrin [Chondrocystis sp. NIES-4102]